MEDIMLGMIVLLIVLGIEIGFTVYCLKTGSYQVEKKSILRIAQFLLLTVFTLIGVIWWGFRWNMLFLILFIKALLGMIYFIRRNKRNEKLYQKKHVIMAGITNVFLFLFAILPAVIFPQFKPIRVTGEYAVKTVSYTLTDPDRLEAFDDNKENRSVTIQFWYPENSEEKYPLVVFSHGAFGFRGSNQSTFKELASNGYVVCSIDHTYHSFFTKQTDGKIVIADMKFINDAMAAQNDDYDDQTTYELSHEWLKLRLGDVDFVLNDILNKASKSASDVVYHLIDTDKIGLFGHSLGGATAAEIGRKRSDIDAVIVIDGTMFGEGVDFKDGKEVFNTDPYPVPLLNIYNEQHYKDALQNADRYANMVATAGARDARQIVFMGAGHLNFTDLPLFSPFLASQLDTGSINSRYCIKTLNHIVLEYFNYYLKDSKELKLQPQY
jgi:dienelactone hydrolase